MLFGVSGLHAFISIIKILTVPYVAGGNNNEKKNNAFTNTVYVFYGAYNVRRSL